MQTKNWKTEKSLSQENVSDFSATLALVLLRHLRVRNTQEAASVRFPLTSICFLTLQQISKAHTERKKDCVSKSCFLRWMTIRGQSESFNLQQCSNLIFYTMDYSFINYDQMLHRVYRMGQKEQVNITILINDGSIENKIWNAVNQKQTLSQLFYAIKGDV